MSHAFTFTKFEPAGMVQGNDAHQERDVDPRLRVPRTRHLYLGRNDLAHVDQSDFSNTALGRGISEGKTDALSKGLTRRLAGEAGVAGNRSEPKGFAGAGTPARSAPTAFSGSNVLALKPASDEAVAYKRDYEERAKELAEDIAFEQDAASTDATAALFTDAAERSGRSQETRRRPRAKSLIQGYTGNSCSECQNFTMVRNGTCEKCDTCGATSGCS